MFSIGRIVGSVVSEMTGNQELGTLVGAGLDMYMGNTQGAAAQLRTADPGLQSQLFSLFGQSGYDLQAGGYGRYASEDYGVSDYMSEQRELDDMYARAKETGNWDEVVAYEQSLPEYEEIDSEDAELFEILDEGEDLLDQEQWLKEQESLVDFEEFESDEQAAGDASRGDLRA